MAGSKKWLGVIRRTFAKSSCKSAVALDVDTLAEAPAAAATKETSSFEQENTRASKKLQVMSIEDVAATMIQACFRGHLARRAYRALRSLVKLQALVRGVCVRRQARIAIQCMQAMVRLQVRVQARQLLNRSEVHIRGSI